MLKTIGYVFTIIIIGGVAIAWSHGPGTGGSSSKQTSPTVGPEFQLNLNTKSLPQTEFSDLTFIYTTEEL